MTQYAATAVADIDPDVCGAFVFCGTLLVVLGCREREQCSAIIATNSVQRAEGREVQVPSQLRVAKEKSSPKGLLLFFGCGDGI